MPDLLVSPSGRKYGALPTAHDPRDLRVGNTRWFLTALESAGTFPAATFNRKFCGPIKDQSAEGSCTGHAGTSNWEFEHRKFLSQSPVFSRQFLYYMERQIEGTLPFDNGAMPRSICQVITKYGVPLESEMPYNIPGNATPPSEQQLQAALKNKSGGYHSLSTLLEVKACLRDLPNFPGHGLLMAFAVFQSFEGSALANSGTMPMPDIDHEECLGGHEVFVADYDDTVSCPGAAPGAVLVQNSWGPEWGADAGVGTRGFFWMPYAALTNPNVVYDLRILHHGSPWKPRK